MILNTNSIFDPITNSEDEMILRAGIKRSEACLYLRSYIIIRLLFSREFVITDSSINLNSALRRLILREGPTVIYDERTLADADFARLIEDGTIKLAVRDAHRSNFSESLRNAQSDKKHVDLPSEQYTDLIDGICKEENIYWWDTEQTTKLFTKKFRAGLETEFSDEINAFLQKLSYRLRDKETLTYDFVKSLVRKDYGEKAEEYQIVHGLLREAYDYNIPEVLNLDYFRFFNRLPGMERKHSFGTDKVEEYDIPWPYAFNFYAFALLPAEWIKDFWKSSEFLRYETAMSQYRKRLADFGLVLDALEEYLCYIDRYVTPLYNHNKFVEDRPQNPQNLIVRFQEHKNGKNPAIITAELCYKSAGAIKTAYELLSEFSVGNAIRFAITVMLPNIVFKGAERRSVLPKIEHAVVKLER